MPSVFDVAKYILHKKGTVTTMKLQKLVYYSYAWHLVWESEPLFNEDIEAWANGPVVSKLYSVLRGKFHVSENDLLQGRWKRLNKNQKESIDVVLEKYGDKPAYWLSELTHSEAPWKDARRGLAPGERSNEVITDEAIAEYYESLL